MKPDPETMWSIEFPAPSLGAALDMVREAVHAGDAPMVVNQAGRMGYECAGTWSQVERLRSAVWAKGATVFVAQMQSEAVRYRVEVHIGEFAIGSVFVMAGSQTEAKAKAVQVAKTAPVHAVAAWETGD
jgi:hypothetical protein